MKRHNITKNILHGLASLLLLSGFPALTSCSSDDEMPESVKQKTGSKMKFRLRVPSTSKSVTRSENWGNINDDSGDDFENTIKNVNPNLFIETGGGIVKAGEFTNITFKPISSGNTYITYEVTGDLTTYYPEDQIAGKDIRLMIEANTNTTGYDINPSLKHIVRGLADATTCTAIPMWGVATMTMPARDENGKYTIPEENSITLLRAAAKVVVNFDMTSENLTNRSVNLTKLEINHMAAEAYALPSKWNKIDNTTNLGTDECFNPVQESGWEYTNLGQTGFEIISTDIENDTHQMYFYLPETPNMESSEDITEPLALTVHYERDGVKEDKTGTVYFHNGDDVTTTADNQGATREDIIRNHIYEFTITGVADSFKPEVKLCIKKWSHEQISIDL